MQTLRILIVDDEADITDVLARGLTIAGYHVDAKNDPLEALASFRAGVYNLLIIDIRMPNIDGFELYEKMVQIDATVKVCFLTAYDVEYFEKFKKRFPHVPTKCFIRKPVAMKDLMQMVKDELRS